MLSSILAFLIQLVILDPLTSQIDARLKQAQVPPALASSVNSCIKEALPDLVRRMPLSRLRAFRLQRRSGFRATDLRGPS